MNLRSKKGTINNNGDMKAVSRLRFSRATPYSISFNRPTFSLEKHTLDNKIKLVYFLRVKKVSFKN